MTLVYVLCEGQTEETFVKEVLTNHFSSLNIHLKPILLRTSSSGRGGVTSYGKIKNQTKRLCLQNNNHYVTTFIDYYGLPSDFVGLAEVNGMDSHEAVESLENSFKEDINLINFIPNLILHEFEGLLYSSTSAFDEWFNGVTEVLQSERDEFDSPEHINNSILTAPSKRIQTHCKGYKKVLHGSLIAIDIGLDTIRSECSHFDNWLSKIERLNTE